MASTGTVVAIGAEFVGTFLLTIVSCASCAGAITDVWGPTAVGFAYMALIYSLSGVSGGHLNPAVTFASALAKKCPWWTAFYYIVAQLLAGALGGFIFTGISGGPAQFAPADNMSFWQPFVVETLFTAFLCFVVLSVTSVRNLQFNQYYALAIGFALTAAGHACGPVSGAAINPAIALGSGLTSGDGNLMIQGFLYIHYEFLGSILAALSFVATRPEDYFESEERVRNYTPMLPNSLAGEWVGTFLITLTMSLTVLAQDTGFAWATGAAVLSLLYSLGDVSGGNFNPAITIGAGQLKTGCTFNEGVAYVLVQALAACAGASVAAGVWGNGVNVAPVAPFGMGAALLLEFMFTTLVVYVYISTVCAKSITTPAFRTYFFGLAVGLAVAGGMFVCANISGGILNPAMSLGLGVTNAIAANGSFMTSFVYILVQIVGGFVASVLFKQVQEACEYNYEKTM